MKKYISIILVGLLLFTNNLALAQDINLESDINIQEDTPIEVPEEVQIEEVLSEEELEAIREAERKAAFEKAVDEVSHLNYGQLSNTYLLGDYETGEILEEKNIDSLVAIASTSKILTVYVVLDEVKKGNISLEDEITIDRETDLIGGSSYELKEGEVVTVDDLIKGAMIVSGNDAVFALSKYISGSEQEFTKLMEAKLDELNIEDYQIINSSGLPNYTINKQNMMTTRGLFQLSRNFLKDYPEILEITKAKEFIEEDREFDQVNTNPILGVVEGIDGLKTGYTGLAGRCMVATGLVLGDGVENTDMRLIGITMGSESDATRYVAIKKLMEKGLSSYENRIIGDNIDPIETVFNENLEPNEISIYPKDSTTLLMLKDDNIREERNVFEINTAAKACDVVGDIKYYNGQDLVYETDLVILEDVFESSTIRKIQIMYRNFFTSAIRLFGGEINI